MGSIGRSLSLTIGKIPYFRCNFTWVPLPRWWTRNLWVCWRDHSGWISPVTLWQTLSSFQGWKRCGDPQWPKLKILCSFDWGIWSRSRNVWGPITLDSSCSLKGWCWTYSNIPSLHLPMKLRFPLNLSLRHPTCIYLSPRLLADKDDLWQSVIFHAQNMS